MTAVEHVPTGELVAYSRLELPLDRLAELRPEARRIHTWNAEENAHMLAINVVLGFRPTGVTGMWQKRLDG